MHHTNHATEPVSLNPPGKLTTRDEQFFSDQYRERGSHCTSDDAKPTSFSHYAIVRGRSIGLPDGCCARSRR